MRFDWRWDFTFEILPRLLSATLKFDTPMWRTTPRSFSSTSVDQPSSISSSGVGQWIW